MLSEEHIKILIASGEGLRLDFKQTITSAQKIAKTLVAFANTDGGVILVGVKDNRALAKIEPDEERYMLDGANARYCSPEVAISFQTVLVQNKKILYAEVMKGNQKPYLALDEDGKYWAYIRQEDNTMLASKIMLDILKLSSQTESVAFEFGENEKNIIKFIYNNTEVNLYELCKNLKIKRFLAINVIVKLIACKVLDLVYKNNIEHYIISREYNKM